MQFIENAWYRRSLWLQCLRPLAWVFRLVSALRRTYYIKWSKRQVFPVPIIVVGNITVGGSGKTPVVLALLKLLQEKGYRPGVVSRGYGGSRSHEPLWVTGDTPAQASGDEPALIAKRAQVPVVVAKDRVAAVEALLTQSDCNVIVSDDGLQHYAMSRDIEMAVVEAQKRFGNGYCLPAGPLREPVKRLQGVDFVVVNGAAVHDGEWAVSRDYLPLVNVQDVNKTLALSALKGQTVHAIAGIGHPDAFFEQLAHLGANVIRHRFSDHYAYQAADLAFDDEHTLVMTEKDAVKCQAFAKSHWWYLPIEARLDENLAQQILSKVESTVNGKKAP